MFSYMTFKDYDSLNKKREEFINANKRSNANTQLLIFCFGVNPPKTPTNLYLISLIFQGT